jgi:CrcB protein
VSPDPDAAPRRDLLPVLLVAVGGVAGSLARYGLSEQWPRLSTTFAINVVGAFLLGALVARRPPQHWSRPLLGTGVLGGFTTFSALAVQTVDASLATGALYLLGTLLAGTAAAAWGLRT